MRRRGPRHEIRRCAVPGFEAVALALLIAAIAAPVPAAAQAGAAMTQNSSQTIQSGASNSVRNANCLAAAHPLALGQPVTVTVSDNSPRRDDGAPFEVVDIVLTKGDLVRVDTDWSIETDKDRSVFLSFGVCHAEGFDLLRGYRNARAGTAHYGFSAPGTGTYRIRVSWSHRGTSPVPVSIVARKIEARQPGTARELHPGETVTGSFNDASFADPLSPGRYDLYLIKHDGERVVIDVSNAQFVPQLEIGVRNSEYWRAFFSMERRTAGRIRIAAGDKDVLLRIGGLPDITPAGDYKVAVTRPPEPPKPGKPVVVVAGLPIEDALTDADPIELVSNDGGVTFFETFRPYKIFEFRGRRGAAYDVKLTSSEFDTELQVVAPVALPSRYAVALVNDDNPAFVPGTPGERSTDSALRTRIDGPEPVLLRVVTRSPDATGKFRLSIVLKELASKSGATAR